MNLKNPSMSGAIALLGVGLITLSGAVLVAGTGEAAHAGITHDATGSAPLAADRSGSVGGRPPITMGQGIGDGCIAAEPLEWFGAIRELPECAAICEVWGCRLTFGVIANDGGLDINRDGVLEFADGPYMHLVENHEIQPPACILSISESVNEGEQIAFRDRCALPTAPFLEIVLSQGVIPSFAAVKARGWRDLDSDGDLDLIVTLAVSGDGIETIRAFWLENTGFEATQPLTGDLDGDGAVGAGDLTILLGGWTGQ